MRDLISNENNKNRPPFLKPPEPYEGLISGKIENCSYDAKTGRLMGVVIGSHDHQREGQFIVTTPVVSCMGVDLYKVHDGSVYIVEWIEEVLRVTVQVLPDDRTEEVHPGRKQGPWHFVWRGEGPKYEEDCWKFYSNGPTEYWKRMDNGYVTPRQAYMDGWRYGGPAVW